jgi:hypothetical protein
MDITTNKICVPKSSSCDSLHLQVNIHELLTSTQNQGINTLKLFHTKRRAAILPTPNRPSSIKPSQPTQIYGKEDNHLLNQHQQMKNYQEELNNQQFSEVNVDQSDNVYNQPKLDSNDVEDNFDIFILQNFGRFSGKQNVFNWLDETELKFNELKICRQRRFEAIPLLIENEAKRRYLIHRKNIQSFDEFYEFLISQFTTTTHSVLTQSQLTMITSSRPKQLSSNNHFEDKQNQTSSQMSNDVYSQYKPSSIDQNTGVDFGATNIIGVVPDTNTATVIPHLSTNILDQTTNDLRKAIVSDLIKNPKIFRGSKDDVQKWTEDIEHLLEIAHIPHSSRLDLISYSLRGDALQWFKTNKDLFTSWTSFTYEIKRAFTSSFHAELAFKKLELYSQGENQSIRNFYNEVLKLCKEADVTMSEATKLKNLLNKTKPSIQFEVRKKKPISPAEFLEYAKDVEELLQLSNTPIDTDKRILSSTSNERSLFNRNYGSASTNQYPNSLFTTKFPSGFGRNSNNTSNIPTYSSQNRNNYFTSQPSNFSSSSIRSSQPFQNSSRSANNRFSANRNNSFNHTPDNNRFSSQSNPIHSSHNNSSRPRTANTIVDLDSVPDTTSEQNSSSNLFCTQCNLYGHELDSCQNF